MWAIIILGEKANKKTLLVIIVMKNKIKSIVTSFVMLVALVFAFDSYAGNTNDTSFNFNFSDLSFERYTDAREKYDKSPAYIYIKNMSINRTVAVRVVFEDHSSTSLKKIYYISNPRTKECISSNAYEDRGYGTKIRLRLDRQGVGSMYANGWWSPDSTTCGW
mgnify:CR=1 FL=1